MAEIGPLTKAWVELVDAMPPMARSYAEQYPPNRLYLHHPTLRRVTIVSYDVDRGMTFTVAVSGKYNSIEYDKTLGGIRPEDLTECDLPAADEVLGAWLPKAQVPDYLAWKASLPLGARSSVADYLMRHVKRSRGRKGK